jgi:hypothetical protein
LKSPLFKTIVDPHPMPRSRETYAMEAASRPFPFPLSPLEQIFSTSSAT